VSCGCSGCTSGGDCCDETYTTDDAAREAADRLGCLLDRGRDMLARAGMRPYSVRIVRARTVGGRRRGDGVSDIVRVWKIRPSPKVMDMSGLQEVLSADQLRELGTVMITGISRAYTEDVLLGRGEDGSPIPNDEIVFYEITFLSVTPRQHRRFVVSAAPFYRAETAEWVVTLTRAPVDRDRRGVL
jgi:hypothetical protein